MKNYMVYTGAGVLLVEEYKGQPVITLFSDHYGVFEDLGGKIDNGETPEQAAYRECREESLNLITLSAQELVQHATPVSLKQFLSYIIHVKNINERDYDHNHKLVYRCRPASWKETISMKRFPLNTIISAASRGNSQVNDVNGTVRTIGQRIIEIIQKHSRTIQQIAASPPHQLTKNKVSNSRMQCLIGTYTYRLPGLPSTPRQQGPLPWPRTSNPIKPATPQLPPPTTKNPTIRQHEYAIYATPYLRQLDNVTQQAMYNCNVSWSGAHITLVGFNRSHPPIKPVLQQLSANGTKLWSLNPKKTQIKGNTIVFGSRTLDKLADTLKAIGFYKVKGVKHSGQPWHITCTGPISKTLFGIFLQVPWNLTIVRKKRGIEYMEKYPLTM